MFHKHIHASYHKHNLTRHITGLNATGTTSAGDQLVAVALDAISTTASDGLRLLLLDVDPTLMAGIRWFLLWITLFYLLTFIFPCLTESIPSSGKKHENCSYWGSRCLTGTLHSLLVAGLTVPTLVTYMTAPTYAQFGASDHLEFCDMTGPAGHWNDAHAKVALAGMIFTTYTLADLVVSLIHNILTFDVIVHHVAYAAAGMLLRSRCMLPFVSAIMLSMEVSTPFLNYVTFFRHRDSDFTVLTVPICGVMFVVFYLIFRVGLNLYGIVLLLQAEHDGVAMPGQIPSWERIFISLALLVGSLIQLSWFSSIMQMFTGRMASFWGMERSTSEQK